MCKYVLRLSIKYDWQSFLPFSILNATLLLAVFLWLKSLWHEINHLMLDRYEGTQALTNIYSYVCVYKYSWVYIYVLLQCYNKCRAAHTALLSAFKISFSPFLVISADLAACIWVSFFCCFCSFDFLLFAGQQRGVL